MTRPNTARRTLVAGALANKVDNGGEAWVRVSWVRALESLGHDVSFIERLGPGLSATQRQAATDWFIACTHAAGWSDRSWLIGPADEHDDAMGGDVLIGDPRQLHGAIAAAGLLVDISGNLTGYAAAERIETRVYIDLDPGYTQVWGHQGLIDLNWHHLHATVGTHIGTESCPYPSDRTWIPVRQPIVIEDWPLLPPPPNAAFSTVTSWRGAFGPLEWQGHHYGVKAHRFREIRSIARRLPEPPVVAVTIDQADQADETALRDDGWIVKDPTKACGTLEHFQRFVQRSAGEFSIAHPAYVSARTGWFSDRTVRYLASGRPAVVEDTGWSSDLPTGAGLFAFVTDDEAVEHLQRAHHEPDLHRRAARRLARQCFAPDVALDALIKAMP